MRDEVKENGRKIGKILGITVAVYACIRWLLPLVVPFFIAFLLAKILNPLVEKLEKKLRGKRSIWSSILVGLLVLMLGALLIYFLKTLLEQAKPYTVSLYQYQIDRLTAEHSLIPLQGGALGLNGHYLAETGFSMDESNLDFLGV